VHGDLSVDDMRTIKVCEVVYRGAQRFQMCDDNGQGIVPGGLEVDE